MAPKKRRITAEDLYNFELISQVEISPDGDHVVYAQNRVDKKSQKKYQNLWLVSTRRGAPRQFTYGDHRDSSPQWSPDGKTIAFISNRGNAKQSQIYLIPVDGGEARPLTELKGYFGGYQWSPDGKQFLVQFSKIDKEVLAREGDKQKKKCPLQVQQGFDN